MQADPAIEALYAEAEAQDSRDAAKLRELLDKLVASVEERLDDPDLGAVKPSELTQIRTLAVALKRRAEFELLRDLTREPAAEADELRDWEDESEEGEDEGPQA